MARDCPGRIVVTAVAAAWLAFMAVYQVDDAYIVYRYASNLARGFGFVYNQGERVEGVSCFLWVLALTPFAMAHIPSPVSAPILSAGAALALLWLFPSASARLTGTTMRADVWGLGGAVLLLFHPSFACWSAAGLETVPFALLLFLAVSSQVDEIDRGSGYASAVHVGLATLIRPETPVLAAALLVARWQGSPDRAATRRLRDATIWTTVVALFWGPFLLFRRLYFGDWVPNTYYAKTGQGLFTNLADGWGYSLDFMSTLCPSFGISGRFTQLCGAILVAVLLAYGLPRRRLLGPALVTGAMGVCILLEGGDWMYLGRFWVPVLPFLMALASVAARDFVRLWPRSRILVVCLMGVFVLSEAAASVKWKDGPNGLAVNAAGYRHAHHEVAQFLKGRAGADDAVALMDVGIIGYETDLKILDLSGLTEPQIARAPGGFLNKDYPIERLLARSPRFFVLVNGFNLDDRIMRNESFLNDYRPVFERNHRFNWTPPQSYTLHVFERAAPESGITTTPSSR